MMSLTKYFILLFTLLISTTSLADTKVVGHMEPLPSEALDQPITLQDCSGLTIEEWRGSVTDDKALKKLNAICKRAIAEFESFIKSKGLKKRNNSNFKYHVALLPDTKNYRGMNDMKFRFADRFVKKELWAYTSRDNRYIFMVSSVDIPEMPSIFSHELFHALSMHYGIFDAHANTDSERVAKDEKLALEFEKYLGV